MSYILDALRKAERERGIAQVPTLMTEHETRRAAGRNRLWAISGICLVCAAAIIWFAISFLRTAGAPTILNSAGTNIVPPEAVSPSVQTAPVPAPKSQAISTNAPRVDAPQTYLPGKKQSVNESRTTITQPQPNVTEPAKNPVQQQTSFGAVGAPALPAKDASPAVTEGITTADSIQPKAMSLREAMAKMKITILIYDEAKSERMVFINDRKYVEGDYVNGLYLLESITANGVVLSYQGERAMLRAPK